MDLVSIGEFARLSRLSAKALRLYDELGLLPPARVDPESGYRFYEVEQLDRARLVASLRQIGVTLAQIKVILDLEPRGRRADRFILGQRRGRSGQRSAIRPRPVVGT
jgi:PPM family protein phosphatase